jgi:hypothetical protein
MSNNGLYELYDKRSDDLLAEMLKFKREFL